jgi:hypothetical protein
MIAIDELVLCMVNYASRTEWFPIIAAIVTYAFVLMLHTVIAEFVYSRQLFIPELAIRLVSLIITT